MRKITILEFMTLDGVMQAPGEPEQQGMGVFEQLIAGPYRPYGVG